MGLRITSRGRPRWDQPFFSANTTTAEAAAAADLMGPFTVHELMALLWRAKKIRVQGTVNYEEYDPEAEEEPYTKPAVWTFDHELTRRNDDYGLEPGGDYPIYAHAADEAELFRINDDSVRHCLFDKNETSGLLIARFGGVGYPYVSKDETGHYWVDWYFSAESAGRSLTSDDYSDYPASFGFNATLELLGAEISLPTRAYAGESVTSAEVTLSVVEWWPYATTSGAAAWSTTTGAPANGGPAA